MNLIIIGFIKDSKTKIYKIKKMMSNKGNLIKFRKSIFSMQKREYQNKENLEIQKFKELNKINKKNQKVKSYKKKAIDYLNYWHMIGKQIK